MKKNSVVRLHKLAPRGQTELTPKVARNRLLPIAEPLSVETRTSRKKWRDRPTQGFPSQIERDCNASSSNA